MEITAGTFRDICESAALELAESDSLAASSAPEFIPSERFKRNMKRLLPHVKNNKYRALTTTARVILVAALIALLAVSVAAKKYIEKYLLVDHGTYSEYIIGKSNGKIDEELAYGYIPERFSLVKDIKNREFNSLEFSSVSGETLLLKKYAEYDHIEINTENRITKEFVLDGTDYLIWGSEKHLSIIWKKYGFLYIVSGNVTENELIEICMDVH
ncbi:MAG: DUF4367 domain-containing protein [Clostridia bacterium]|nr:DUF4367 domain-containing protein [Clostridia bacterium]